MVLKILKKKIFSKFLNRGFVLSGLLENQHKYILNFWYGCTEKCPPEATLSFFFSNLSRESGLFYLWTWNWRFSGEKLVICGPNCGVERISRFSGKVFVNFRAHVCSRDNSISQSKFVSCALKLTKTFPLNLEILSTPQITNFSPENRQLQVQR